MAGHAETEISLYLAADRRNFSVTWSQARQRLCEQMHGDTETIERLMTLYREVDPSRDAAQVMAALGTDYIFRAASVHNWRAWSRSWQAPLRLYNFAWRSPAAGGVYRTPHTLELPFFFGNLDVASRVTAPSTDAEQVSQDMVRAIADFAHGRMEEGGVPHWPTLQGDPQSVWQFGGEGAGLRTHYLEAEMQALSPLPSFTHYQSPLSLYTYRPG